MQHALNQPDPLNSTKEKKDEGNDHVDCLFKAESSFSCYKGIGGEHKQASRVESRKSNIKDTGNENRENTEVRKKSPQTHYMQ